MRAVVLVQVGVDENVLAIVPSHRVSSKNFFGLLRNNGLSPRAIGMGSGKVVDADGRPGRVGGILVIALPITEMKRAQNLARLCGITAVSTEK